MSTESERESLLTRPFITVLCVQFCFGLSYSSFFLLPKFLTRELHASADAIGVVAAMALVAGVVATPWLGPWLDRGRRRPFMTYGALVNGLAGAAFALVHSVALPIYVFRAIHGISYSLVFNATVTLCADLAPPKKLGQAIGLCGAAGMIANAIAPALAEVIADHHGWPLVWLLAGSCALLASLLSLMIREPRHVPPSEHIPDSRSVFELINVRERRGAFLCGAANGAAFGLMFTFTQPYALELGANRVSAYFIGYTIVALAVRLFLGSLADTWGRRRIAFAALVLYGLVAALTSQLRPSLLFAIGAGTGLSHGLLYPAVNALAIEGVPRERRGVVMSYFFGAFNTGFAVWVSGMGVVARHWGYPVVFIATGLMVWSSLPFLPKKSATVVA